MSKARIVLPIEGMTCASCAATVQEALTGASGVTAAGVNFATNKAAIEYDDALTQQRLERVKTVCCHNYPETKPRLPRDSRNKLTHHDT